VVMTAEVIEIEQGRCLPCPFCGGIDLHIEGERGVDGCWGVICDNDNCEAWGPCGQETPEIAIARWNSRP